MLRAATIMLTVMAVGVSAAITVPDPADATTCPYPHSYAVGRGNTGSTPALGARADLLVKSLGSSLNKNINQTLWVSPTVNTDHWVEVGFTSGTLNGSPVSNVWYWAYSTGSTAFDYYEAKITTVPAPASFQNQWVPVRIYRLVNSNTWFISINETVVSGYDGLGEWFPSYFAVGLETRDSANSVSPGYTGAATLQWLFFNWQTTWPNNSYQISPSCNLSAFWNTPGWGWIDDQN